MKVSVVIPTHNPNRAVLTRVCQALAAQTLPADCWEVIVVDNASTPPLRAEELHPLRARLLAEPMLGSRYARQTGIDAAAGEFLVFADDDNVLDSDYLREAVEFLETHPEAGAVGGVLEPEFEVPPAGWVLQHVGLLAIRDLGDQTRISAPGDPPDYPWFAPYGAGMAIRAECARRFRAAGRDNAALSIGRIGTRSLGGCEDAEIIFHGVLRGGLQVAYHPRLKLIHCIPRRRLAFAYLAQLAYETGISWGEFCTRHSFEPPIPAWSRLPRQAVQFFRARAWTRAGWITWRSYCGRMTGRVRA